MFLKQLQFFAATWLVLALVSCSSQDSFQLNGSPLTNESKSDVELIDGGISTGNPVMLKLPTRLVPDLDDILDLPLPEPDQAIDESAISGVDPVVLADERKIIQSLLASNQFMKSFLKKYLSFTQISLDSLRDSGITELKSLTPISVKYDGTLLGVLGHWKVEFLFDKTKPQELKLSFYNLDFNELFGVNIISLNSAGDPIQGVMVLVDPSLLLESAYVGSKHRLVAFSFDFTASDTPKFILRRDFSTLTSDGFFVEHIHYDCVKSQKSCRGLVVGIDQDVPLRGLSSSSLEFQIDYEASSICGANVSYDTGSKVWIKDPIGYNKGAHQVTLGCELDQAVAFESKVYQETDLPCRYGDVCGDTSSTAAKFNGKSFVEFSIDDGSKWIQGLGF